MGQIGWKLTLAAGFVPLSAGLSSMLSARISYAAPEQSFHSMLGPLGFSVSQVAANAPLAEYFRLTGSVGAVNIVAAAVYVLLASWFGLRAGQRWAWYALLFSLIWVGGNDATAATAYYRATGIPFLIAPWSFVVLMSLGLALSARSVFRRE